MISTENRYTYQSLENDLKASPIPCRSIGKSVEGRNIYVLTLGTGKKSVLYIGAHHGAEWLTAPILMQLALDCTAHYNQNTRLCGYDISALYAGATLHILPMLNPDGIEIAARGKLSYTSPMYRQFSKAELRTWQSNARGVDLNHNYNANFQKCKQIAEKMGITGPGPTRYSGPHPESEPEVQAVCRYVRAIGFDLCLALHSQGEVIYYDYNGYTPPGSKDILKILCRESGYMPDLAEGVAAGGGFKDWFIKAFHKPAYTVEIGKGKNPLPGSQFREIYEKTLKIFLLSAFLC